MWHRRQISYKSQIESIDSNFKFQIESLITETLKNTQVNLFFIR